MTTEGITEPSKTSPVKGASIGSAGAKVLRLAAYALIIYSAFASYLAQPCLDKFSGVEYLIPAYWVISAMGCFLLCRRWVGVFWADLVAGLVYGFSPLVLGFSTYHPIAGAICCIMVWGLLPAVYWPVGKKQTLYNRLVTIALAAVPLVIIIGIFRLGAEPAFGAYFPLPKTASLEINNLPALLSPLLFEPHNFLLSFYHVPLCIAALGLIIYILSRRRFIIIVACVAVAMAFYKPVLMVSPVVWALIAVLFVSVLAGIGCQAIAWSGKADGPWVLVCAALAGVLAIISYLAGLRYDKEFYDAAHFYLLAIFMILSIHFISRASVRWHPLRWMLICSAVGLDVLIGARTMVDSLF